MTVIRDRETTSEAELLLREYTEKLENASTPQIFFSINATELRAILTEALLKMEKPLSVYEAAAYLGLSRSAIYKLTSTKKIPHYKPMGKMVYFDRRELDEWIHKHPIITD